MNLKHLLRGAGVAVWSGTALLLAPACGAQLLCHIRLDTSPLAMRTGPFAVNFQLNDGDLTNNNRATLTHFTFGGGMPVGAPRIRGDAGGDMASAVSLTDRFFLNSFTQDFVPGDALEFDLALTTNPTFDPAPDQFSFAVLNNGAEIPTTGLGDVFLLVDITSTMPGVRTFGTDPSRTDIRIAAPTAICSVPEPGAAALLCSGFTALAAVLFQRRRAGDVLKG